MTEGPEPSRPFDLLGRLAIQEAEIADGLWHVEVYTTSGLLTIFWHGDRDAERGVLMCGGAMGGMLGPANGLYHDLGVSFAAEGIQTLRVGYRQANQLDECVLDLAAAADLAVRAGAKRFVSVGHSFGGAVAVGVALALPAYVVGVVGLATQSAGCENAGALGGRPLLLLHGDRDEILPPMCSEVVAALAGSGEVVLLAGAGHLLTQAADEVRYRLSTWIPKVLA